MTQLVATAHDALRALVRRLAVPSRLLDAILRRRAQDIIRRTQLDRQLPAAGLLLDLGSGLGHLAEAVQHGSRRRCISIDPLWSPQPALVARQATEGPSFVHADGTHLPFPDRSFDGGWCAFVLHHMAPDAQGQALAEAARVLRPGAPFILIEDTPVTGATVQADRRLNVEPHGAPHHYRSPAEWRVALTAIGLPPQAEIAFTAVFPRATWRPVPHLAFMCRRAA